MAREAIYDNSFASVFADGTGSFLGACSCIPGLCAPRMIQNLGVLEVVQRLSSAPYALRLHLQFLGAIWQVED